MASLAGSQPSRRPLGAESLRAQYSFRETPAARAASRSAPCRPGSIRRTNRPEDRRSPSVDIVISPLFRMILLSALKIKRPRWENMRQLHNARRHRRRPWPRGHCLLPADGACLGAVNPSPCPSPCPRCARKALYTERAHSFVIPTEGAERPSGGIHVGGCHRSSVLPRDSSAHSLRSFGRNDR